MNQISRRDSIRVRAPLVRLLLLALMAVLVSFASGSLISPDRATGQEIPDLLQIEGQILILTSGDYTVDVGFIVGGFRRTTPVSLDLPARCGDLNWLESPDLVLNGLVLGKVIVRRSEGGAIESGFRPPEGDDIFPRMRFLPASPGADWSISSPISLSMPAPDVTPWFRSTISKQFLELDQRASLLLPEADVLWWELAYSLEPHVPGLIFNPETRRIGGMPSEAGSYEMVYRASTTAGGFAELQFTIDVGIPEPSDPEPSDPEPSDEAMEQDSMDDSMEQDSMMEDDSEMSDEAEEAADESEPDIGTPSAVPSATTFAENPRTGFTLTSEDDTSTFSLDVDQTSYFLALNWSRNNYLIEPDSARAEEWVNSFDYGYAAPESDDEFAISTSIQPHPLNDDLHIARIGFQAPELPDDAPLNVALVLDASGSMSSGNRVAIARAAAESIHDGLRCIDRIAVVHFTTSIVSELTVESAIPGHPEVASSIARLVPRSSTNVQRGLDLGVRLVAEMRKQRPDAFNYVILMSDGVANVDATDPFKILERTGDSNQENPIRLITVGVGISNYNDFLLEQLAQHGNGWYRYLDTPEQARETFAREQWLQLSRPFADQARAQVVWNEAAVGQWRLIGYENRVTSAESFVEDRTEFAEIPSDVAVTSLYELELTDAGKRALETSDLELGTVALRWKSADTGESKSLEHAWELGPAVSEDSARAALDQFAAIVALAADRYGAIDSARDVQGEQGRQVAPTLRTLQDALNVIRDELPAGEAIEEFARLLNHLIISVPEPVDSSDGGQ